MLGEMESIILLFVASPLYYIVDMADQKKDKANQNGLDPRLVKFVFWAKLKSGVSYFASIASALLLIETFWNMDLVNYILIPFSPLLLFIPVICFLYGMHFQKSTNALLKINKKQEKTDEVEQLKKALDEVGKLYKKEVIYAIIAIVLTVLLVIVLYIAAIDILENLDTENTIIR